MKKIIIPLTTLIIGINIIIAKNVDINTAQTVAQNFFNHSTDRQDLILTLAFSENTKDGSPVYFVFNGKANEGFIIVSGDDKIIPVLGYSKTGHYVRTNLPPNFVKWMEGYKQQILYIMANDFQTDNTIQNKWLAYKNNQFISTEISSTVNPLLKTTWNQSPYYNALCPGGSVTGCVATAMAQVMKYWNYPAQGTDFHSYNEDDYGTLSANFGNTTYDWTNMPNDVTSSNNAVATLMYHCGVSVNMNYSPQSSGAFVIADDDPDCSENAFKNYFGYKSSLQGVERKNYTDANWMSLLKIELDASRPILYDGFGNGGGHAFVCDGYDNNDFFHFNWGWGGYYDGYFEMNALNPSGTGTGGGAGGYNSGQQAVIGVEPRLGGSVTNYDMRLYSDMTVNPNPINYNSGFSVTVNLANYGTGSTNNFSGDYKTAIFNSNNQFISDIEIKTGYTLDFNSYYMNPLVFTTSSIPALTPGNYSIGVYYKPTGTTQWTGFANGNYQNFVSIQVQGNNTNTLKLYTEIITTPSNVIQNQTFDVTFDIANYGSSTFTGAVSVDIHKSDGTWIRELSIKNGLSLPSNSHFINGLTYTITDGVDDEPGTYQLFVWDSINGANWEVVGNGTFLNPITIQVVAPSLNPDLYETNDIMEQAYNLPITFSGNYASKNTASSNIHITSDNDFYKIVLESGYDYQINARAQDSYNSDDGNTYTCDVLFSYYADNDSSDTFDDIMPNNISINNGGTVTFQIAPYFAGEKGTYLLDLNITQTLNGAINEITFENSMKAFPIPTSNTISLELKNSYMKSGMARIQNYLGQTVKEFPNQNFSLPVISFDVSDLSDGIFFIQIPQDYQKIMNKKFTILR